MEFRAWVKAVPDDKPTMNNLQNRSLPGQKDLIHYFWIKYQSHLDAGELFTNLQFKTLVTANEQKSKLRSAPLWLLRIHNKHRVGHINLL